MNGLGKVGLCNPVEKMGFSLNTSIFSKSCWSTGTAGGAGLTSPTFLLTPSAKIPNNPLLSLICVCGGTKVLLRYYPICLTKRVCPNWLLSCISSDHPLQLLCIPEFLVLDTVEGTGGFKGTGGIKGSRGFKGGLGLWGRGTWTLLWGWDWPL